MIKNKVSQLGQDAPMKNIIKSPKATKQDVDSMVL